ncbi:PQQ-dependent sugar dehydrogenase [Paenibacillus xerothermodurans]|uniref:PQQ-dependent sugar dehydrogenase n=1 Tax=Paenibacillus xerothermodurans TaxID=1977292 RepID=A0A2W1N8D2_PAEXE|nr:PQQ-dependent sugar dehydrogenase [Paenibacillus xerothermodurans]PZE20144.1 PQQ-dependent sugar dehydrogenase [Paenibacillus xerothermodurans]
MSGVIGVMIGAANDRWFRSVAVLSILLFISGCLSESQVQDDTTSAASAPAPGIDSAKSAPSNRPAVQPAEKLPYKPEVLASDLKVPWDMDFAPDGRIFFTERGGVIRVIEQGKVREEPVFRFEQPPFYSESEAGLLGITLDREFGSNGYMYVYHTYQENGATRNRVLRLQESGGRAKLDKVILDALPGDRIHDGGRIKFGPDGLLYITSGDANQTSLAQDPAKLGGKILRIHADGSIPADNPFPGSPVYSLGHRNPQGLAWHPVTKKLFSSEHGQRAHDEINQIEAGVNYGWPLIEGDETQVSPQEVGKQGPGVLRAPLLHSGDETWAPSGVAFITQGPWKGNLLVANLRGTQVLRLILDGQQQSVEAVQPLFKNELGRIRNVAEGPDGSIYLMTNNTDGRGNPGPDDDRIIRLKPAF